MRNPRYVIAVHDLERSARYYRDVRGARFIMAGECRDALSPAELGDHSYCDEPWGMREFGVRTVDGHRIMFGQPVRS